MLHGRFVSPGGVGARGALVALLAGATFRLASFKPDLVVLAG
jgi:hypothetical protein